MTTCLAQAIFRYRAEWNGYMAATYDDDDAPRSYEPSQKVLETWSTPAEDRSAAVAALELAIELHAVGDCEIIPAMMKAALAWINADAKRRAAE